MFVATLETRAFTFTAAGVSEAQAISSLREAWHIHAASTGAQPWEHFADGVAVIDIQPGECYRDFSRIF